MAFPDRRTANILFTILLFAVVLTVLYIARWVILIFVAAILFSYLIDPVVRFLQRHSLLFKNLRGPFVVEAYIAFLILTALTIHGVAPQLSTHANRLFKEAPAMFDRFSTGEMVNEIGDTYGWSEAEKLRLKAFLLGHQDNIQTFVRGSAQFTSNALVVLVAVPILAIFFLADGANMAEAVIKLVSTEGNHQAIRSVADELNAVLKKYVRVKVILGGSSLVFYSAALLLLRFPQAIGLGVLGGVLEFIPVVGWMISAAAIIGVGALAHAHWIWMAALLGIWRIVMDYFLSPRVVGHNLEIHPLMVILAVMVGGEIGGIVGVYLSIPFMVVIRVIWSSCASSSAGIQGSASPFQPASSDQAV